MTHRPIASLLPPSIALACLATPAAAQIYGGSYNLSAEGDANCIISGTITSGPTAEIHSHADQGTTLTGSGCVAGVGSESLVLSYRRAFPGRLFTSCAIQGVQHTASPCGNTAGGRSWMSQRIDATDVVFRRISNPLATGTVQVALNVEFQAFAPQPFACGGSDSYYTICAGAGTYPCKILGKRTWDGSNSYGPIASYPNDDSLVVLTSGTFQVPLLTPTGTHLESFVNTKAVLCESANPSSTALEVHALVSLPRSGPVFALPPDVTVDSPQLGIVDNRWMPPARHLTTLPVLTGATLAVCCSGPPGQPVWSVVTVHDGGLSTSALGPQGVFDAEGHWTLSALPSPIAREQQEIELRFVSLRPDGGLEVGEPLSVHAGR